MIQNVVVVDSSVIVKWLNRDDEQDIKQADKLLSDWESGKITIVAPELVKYEVGGALLYKHLAAPALTACFSIFYAFPISYVAQTEETAKKVGEIARVYGMTFYDATFVQLAKELNATLVTVNPKHQKKVKFVRVIPLFSYK